MSIHCTKEITLKVNGGCSAPSPVNYTLPVSVNSSITIPFNATYYGLAAIGGAQNKAAIYPTNDSLYYMSILNMTTPVATVIADFVWPIPVAPFPIYYCSANCYEPVSGLIVSIVVTGTGGVYSSFLAFTNPVTGHVSNIPLVPVDVGGWFDVGRIELMRDKPGKVLAMGCREPTPTTAQFYVVNCMTQTIESQFNVSNVEHDNPTVYCCHLGQVAVPIRNPPTPKIQMVNVADGSLGNLYTGIGFDCTYLYSTKKMVLHAPLSNTNLNIVDPANGNVESTVALPAGMNDAYSVARGLWFYDYKIDRYVAPIFDSNVFDIAIATFNPSTLALVDITHLGTHASASQQALAFAEDSGSIYWSENSSNSKWHRWTPTIIP